MSEPQASGAGEATPPPEENEAKEEDEEEEDAEDGYASPRRGIEEIKVTARQREENLQQTPISITAFSEQALQDRGVRDLTELTLYTPNLRFTAGAAQATSAQVYIRGIGQSEGTINAEPRVGLYLDGIYQARPLGSILSVFDLQRIEVLRGPQGTLYGKNAIGGAINVISNVAAPDYEAKIEIEYGNLDYIATRLMGNLPVDVLGLGDKLFLRGNFVYENRYGYTYDRHLNEDFSSRNLLGGTASLRLLPVEGLDLRVNYHQSSEDQKSRRGECEPVAGAENSAFNRAISSPEGMDALGGDFQEECAASEGLVTSTNMPNLDVLEAKKIHGFITWDVPELPWVGALTFESLTGYQSLVQNFNFDWDSTATTIIHSEIRDLGHAQLSQEVRFHGSAWDERFLWTVGGFFLKEHTWGPPTFTELLAPDFNVNGTYFPLGIDVAEVSNFDHRTGAAFFFGTVEPVDRLHLTGGFRYGWEEKSLFKKRDIGLCNYFAGIGCFPQTPGDDGKYNIFGQLEVPSQTEAFVTDSWTAPTGNLSITWDFTDDVHAFVGYQRGFSSGGFNYIGDDENQTPNRFEPETLDGVEVGVKSTWLDRRLSVNANYYWNYYDNMQVRIQEASASGTSGQFLGVTSQIRNAGEATIQGAEVEIVGMPVDDLMLTGNLGLTFPQYRDFEVLDAEATREASDIASCGSVGCSTGGNPITIVPVYVDFTDNAFPNTPQVNFQLGARYTWRITDGIEITPGVDYSWQQKVYFDIANTEELSQGDMGLLNASLAIKLVRTDTRLAFWIKNATDEVYRTGGFSLGSWVSRYYGMPRTLGFTFTQRFGGP
jgi:iron complex outermembrane receptor protein